MDWQSLNVSLQLAVWTTVILFPVSVYLSRALAWRQFAGKSVIEALVALPLVLPPTVLGFYLLVLLGANGPLSTFGIAPVAFTFSGLVFGSVIYSMPFVIQPLHDAFLSIGKRPMEVAATLRASPWDRFFTIALPLARPGFITACVLGFAHTIGEFGVVLMIGGNIPGQTQVLSIAIYDHVESLDYTSAHWLSGGLIALSFLMLATVYATNKRFRIFRL